VTQIAIESGTTDRVTTLAVAYPLFRLQIAKYSMATDYDAPRTSTIEDDTDSLQELKAQRADAQSGTIDVDEGDLDDILELPGADLSGLSGEELTVRVLPRQADEFTCSNCFLLHHRSQLASHRNGQPVCRDCA
jgi:Domain of unknown function (DUF4193)